MQPVEKFNQDGLAYDATLMIEGGRAFPVAFNESVSVSEAQSSLSFFTSSRGRRHVAFRGKTTHSWSVSMTMPWDYVSMLATYVESQRAPRFLMTPHARRNNFLCPANEGPTQWVGTVGSSPNKSFGSLVESSFTASDGYILPTYWADPEVGSTVYGNETWVIPGTTVRFRVFARGKGAVFIWGKNGTQYSGAPLAQIQVDSTEMREYISDPFILPQEATGVVDAYASMKEFTPVQMWVGTHVPPISPRLGGWAVIKDFSYSTEPSVRQPLVKASFTLEEVW